VAKLKAMFSEAPDNSSETNRLLRATDEGQPQCWDALLQRHRERLRRMVSLRVDRRLRGWVDPSEVVRLACAEATSRRREYLDGQAASFFLWLRGLAGARLQSIQVQRLGAAAGEIGQELALAPGSLPQATSQALAAQLLGQAPEAGPAAARARRLALLEEALNGLAAPEREALALRHFEQLSGAETAALLGLPEGEAGRLYVRALKRVREALQSLSTSPREKSP
jgi:RNA polymerase sigma-70 factor (ECF subfamily)